MFYSQAGQDKWVLDKIAKGFFVDVGAHDGIESSNTFALEQAGWEGLCIEPSSFYDKLTENRNCLTSKVAAHYYNGFLNGVPCRTLRTLLTDTNCPKEIDYLSIDVDGGELTVLQGMDFETFHVKLITIEHNQYLEGTFRQDEIFKHLTGHGFKRTHKDVKCLDPNYFGLIYEDWYENINDKPKG